LRTPLIALPQNTAEVEVTLLRLNNN